MEQFFMGLVVFVIDFVVNIGEVNRVAAVFSWAVGMLLAMAAVGGLVIRLARRSRSANLM